MITCTEKRGNTALRMEFDKAFNDLYFILPLYSTQDRIGIINTYLKAYNLLNSNSAKGRLIIKLKGLL